MIGREVRGRIRRPRIPRGAAREFSLFATATVLYQGARFALSLAAARSLAPADLSAWALFVALLAYAPSLLIGVSNGMNRDLPILIGAGDEARARRAVQAAWGATILACVAVYAVGVLLAVGPFGAGLAPLLVATAVAGTIVVGVQQFMLRSRLRFDAASVQLGTFGVAALAAAAALVAESAEVERAVALYGAAALVAVIVGAVLDRPALQVRLDLDEMRRLATIGFPIMLAGLVFAVFVTLDRWIAIALFGAERAASYALASLVAAAVLVVPNVVSQQTYPRMAIAHGQGATAERLLAMARRQGHIAAALTAPVAAGAALFAAFGIPAVLPRYAAVGPAVLVLCGGLMAMAWLAGYGNYLNVVGAQWRYLASQVAGVTIATVLMVVAGMVAGLLGIAIGMAAGLVIYGWLVRVIAARTGPADGQPVTG